MTVTHPGGASERMNGDDLGTNVGEEIVGDDSDGLSK